MTIIITISSVLMTLISNNNISKNNYYLINKAFPVLIVIIWCFNIYKCKTIGYAKRRVFKRRRLVIMSRRTVADAPLCTLAK